MNIFKDIKTEEEFEYMFFEAITTDLNTSRALAVLRNAKSKGLFLPKANIILKELGI